MSRLARCSWLTRWHAPASSSEGSSFATRSFRLMRRRNAHRPAAEKCESVKYARPTRSKSWTPSISDRFSASPPRITPATFLEPASDISQTISRNVTAKIYEAKKTGVKTIAHEAIARAGVPEKRTSAR